MSKTAEIDYAELVTELRNAGAFHWRLRSDGVRECDMLENRAMHALTSLLKDRDELKKAIPSIIAKHFAAAPCPGCQKYVCGKTMVAEILAVLNGE